jgi:hypothetical protein
MVPNVCRVSLPLISSLTALIRVGRAHVLEQNDEQALVHYLDEPNHPDEWVELDNLTPLLSASEPKTTGKKRKRGTSGRSPSVNGNSAFDVAASSSSGSSRRRGPRARGDSTLSTRPSSTIKGEEEEDYHDPKITNAKRNVDMVHFGDWKIKTWCVVLQRLNSGQALLTPTRLL